MNERARVKALCDMFTDSHAELMVQLAKYNVNQFESECMATSGGSGRSNLRREWAKDNLKTAVALIRAHSLRALRVADELETL